MYFRDRWEKEHPDLLVVDSLAPRLRDTVLWSAKSCYVRLSKQFGRLYCSAQQIAYACMMYAKEVISCILIGSCWYRGEEVVELLLGDYEGTLIEQADYVYSKITGQKFHYLHEVEPKVQGGVIDCVRIMLGGDLLNGLAPYIERLNKEFSKEEYKGRILKILQGN